MSRVKTEMAQRNMEDEITARVNAAVAAALEQRQPPAAVNVVAVKLPEFWTEDPDVWFYQAECAFNRARILLLSVTPDTVDPYETLKGKLVADYGRTKWQRAFALLDHPDIGDRRPSRLMGDMLALLPTGEEPNTVFLALFLRRLPASMRDHLAAGNFNTPAEMATHADLLWDARATQSLAVVEVPSVAAISGREGSPRDARGRSPDRRQFQRGKGGGRGRGGRRQTPGVLCHAHKKFGADAYSCFPPCSWRSEN